VTASHSQPRTTAAEDPLARVESLERFKDAVADVLGVVPRETIDLWSIFRDDALALSYFLDELHYDITALDLGTFVGVSALLLAVVVIASAIPARRASNVPPAEALRDG
jgi:ABC-type lipoprotein release transport system permease subunit